MESPAKSMMSLLENTGSTIAKCSSLKVGLISLELINNDAGDYFFNVSTGKKVQTKAGKGPGKPKIQIRGDGQQIRMVLEGKRDARKAFLAGKIQVRGDIPYLEILLEEAGLMHPIK